ncbi:MAG: RNA polymerase sigma factor [bacterium]|nr:RNA polymerase sigma factor [bacterium]
MTDAQIMLQVKNGDAKAFEQLVEKYKLPIINFCLRFSGNKDDAEDLAQDVFVRVFQAAERYEDRAKFSTWLYRIAVNLCLNHQRRKKLITFLSLDRNHHDSSERSSDNLEALFSSSTPEREYELKEQQRLVQQAINSLPENQKTVVILYRYHNLSYQEIAKILNISISAVESRLHRAKLNLKKRLLTAKKQTKEI